MASAPTCELLITDSSHCNVAEPLQRHRLAASWHATRATPPPPYITLMKITSSEAVYECRTQYRSALTLQELFLVFHEYLSRQCVPTSFAGRTRAGLHPNAMIHIIRIAGELNVFHYCHSSEEVGGEGRRGGGGAPRLVFSRSPTLSLLARESRDARRLRLTHLIAIRVCVPSRCRDRSSWSRVQCPPRTIRRSDRSYPQLLCSAHQLTAQLIKGATAGPERTVSAIDDCMHALDFTFYVSILSRWRNGSRWMDRMNACRTSAVVSLGEGCDFA